ncbi:predicted N-acyltransferase, GNAT family [Nitrosomonas sp. PY1]|uniref:GNAT family N-acetyltransferase n=1 Tax=Nitrosomonas sp. PY1 TaxID=1803906 RepID=UPI001FC7F27F|nr:GNAT family N-acetyltransferase [Nitrosomonas sp. PY1]GKS68878.1 predicted N-acyltransferase, GNAT family [Nitrosomonas sp. PY1]
MSDDFPYRIEIVNWRNKESNLRSVRSAVFIAEQNVPEEMEWDSMDQICTHILVQDFEGNSIGTARLLPDGHIGRMAVLKVWRRKGIGAAMLRRILQEMRALGMKKATLHAQLTAVEFYEKFGFQKRGKEFMEAGIPHIIMVLDLS